MSILTKIKNWFGFGFNDDDPDDDRNTQDDGGSAPAPTPWVRMPKPADQPIEVSAEMMSMIFDKVVEVTNSSVPQYFAKSLNPEKQKKFLYESLDTSIKDYLAALSRQADDRCRAMWQSESDALKKEADSLRQRAKDLEARRNEMNEQRLSSDRQRRALTDRVRDLETTVMKLEADKEQLQIENRGLINKAKAANVYEADIEMLKKQIEEYKSHADASAVGEENVRLKEEITQLQTEVEKLTEACEAAKVKDQMEGAMLNDLQKRASESLQSAKVSEAKIEELQSTIALRDAQIVDLKNEIAEKDSQLEEDEETMEAIEALAEQLDKFEQVKVKLQERISSLKTELQASKEEAENLRKTIKNNLYAHAQQEKSLIDEIDRLKTLADK